jgi:hypothetical protein
MDLSVDFIRREKGGYLEAKCIKRFSLAIMLGEKLIR